MNSIRLCRVRAPRYQRTIQHGFANKLRFGMVGRRPRQSPATATKRYRRCSLLPPIACSSLAGTRPTERRTMIA